MGFSYDVGECKSQAELAQDFSLMRSKFHARYVRMYGNCDNAGFWDDIIAAATESNVGIYSLVWFGFDGDDKWKKRLSSLIKTVQTNPKAPFVIRNIAIGSEPLYDGVLSPDDMAVQIVTVQKKLQKFGMQVTVSEMPYGYQSNGDAPQVFQNIDIVEGNVLPFFSADAKTGANAWGNVYWAIGYFTKHAPGKILRVTQTGWPSSDEVWKANNEEAVASVDSEKQYFDLLDGHCDDFKNMKVGWFAHIFDDDTLPGWGILKGDRSLKFDFKPRITC
ncbi:glycoside hydrolase family 17 protein [Atractiella rhizophila]|nr:glycoside hydrolase family 17 protein [Atractiella rhizophila]